MLACYLAAFALGVAGCRPKPFPSYPANYREYAYVTNGGSGTVTVIDVVDVRVDREIPVGLEPGGRGGEHTRNEIYVVNAGAPGGNGSLAVIDAEHNRVVATIGLHRQPVSIDLDKGGKLAYVANSGSNSVSVIDVKTRREVAQIGTGRTAGRGADCVRRQDAGGGQPRRQLGDGGGYGHGKVRARVYRLPRRGRPGDHAGFLEGVCALLSGPPGNGDRVGRRTNSCQTGWRR